MGNLNLIQVIALLAIIAAAVWMLSGLYHTGATKPSFLSDPSDAAFFGNMLLISFFLGSVVGRRNE